VLLLALRPQAQAPGAPWALLNRDGRRPVPTVAVDTLEFIALDDVAALFQVVVTEGAGGNATLAYRGRTIGVVENQPTASVNGRTVSLSSPVIRSGGRWLVPPDFLQSALGPIYEQRIQVRRAARLIILGDLRVPRVTARIDADGPPTRLTLDVSPPAAITTTQDGLRVVVRIDADALDASLPAGSGLVQQLRPGDQPNTIVLTLDPGAGAVRAAASAQAGGRRLTLDVPAGSAPAAGADAPGAGARPSPAMAPVLDPSLWLAPRARLQTVVIDPGHGGDDAGVRGGTGTLEKQIALDVARRLRTLLETRLGLRVILTRDQDVTVGLDVRAAIANTSRADLFLSLHLNAASSPEASGAEVYTLRLDSEGELARRQADETAVAVPLAGGGSRTIQLLRWDLAQARHVESSTTLAAIIAENLGRDPSAGPVLVRAAPLRLLEEVNMPAALVEMAFLTNRAQEKRSDSNQFKDAAAEALHEAVGRFKRLVDEAEPR
jgi:N-acetylmuramoyl-L-alanine amidase